MSPKIYIGSNERMAMQNLHVPETAESIIVPKWDGREDLQDTYLFHVALSEKRIPACWKKAKISPFT